MVGFCRKNAGGRIKIRLAADQRSRALVGSHADIFEDERPKQEILVVGVWVERDPGTHQASGACRA